MTVTQTVTLSGAALHGYGPDETRFLTAQLPVEVRLGRIQPAAQSLVLPLQLYSDVAKLASALPASTNRRSKVARALARMYLNDRYGCCVISGKLHALALWSAADGNGEIEATDQEVYSQYVGICGPGDRGCVITQVLDVMRTKGLQAGGKRWTIDGYVSVDWRVQELVKALIFLFGAGTFGIDLPEAWLSQAVWDVTNSRIVGGHDVTPVDYEDNGVVVSSWGRLYLMTWAAVVSHYIRECYALLASAWYGSDKLAPCGINSTALRQDLAKLAAGQVPDITPPQPPPTGNPRVTIECDRTTGEFRFIKE